MYKVTANGENIQQEVVEIVADSLTDIDDLQEKTNKSKYYGPGSTCIVIENSSVWMLGNDRVWHEL